MKIREAILKMGTYKPPLEGRNPKEHLLMDFNESPYPPPDYVQDQLIDFIRDNRLNVYPSYGDFLELLGRHVGVSPDSLIITNGSDQALEICLRCFLDPGDEMVLAKPGFGMFFQIAGTLGAKVISPLYRKDMAFPFEEIKVAVSSKTRLIVLINPNNPTGTPIALQAIEDLLSTFPEQPILVDEAYFEFTQHTALPLLASYSNLIITRTFSKAFAIPSLRLGYAIGRPDFIQHLYKIRGPYDVNMVALVAARAQLERPQIWQERIRHIMEESKPTLERFFDESGVTYFKGAAHFMLVQPKNVQETLEFLKTNGILVRPMSSPIEHTFRVSVGTLEQTQYFILVYKKYLRQS